MASASFVTPHATALTREMSYSPKRRLMRDGVTLLALMTEPKLLAVKRPFLTKCQEGLFLWPTVKELIWFTISLSTFNFRLINSSCSAAVDRGRNSLEKISSSTVKTGRSPSGFGSGLNSQHRPVNFHTLAILNTALPDLLDLVVGVRLYILALLEETFQQ